MPEYEIWRVLWEAPCRWWFPRALYLFYQERIWQRPVTIYHFQSLKEREYKSLEVWLINTLGYEWKRNRGWIESSCFLYNFLYSTLKTIPYQPFSKPVLMSAMCGKPPRKGRKLWLLFLILFYIISLGGKSLWTSLAGPFEGPLSASGCRCAGNCCQLCS